VGPVVDVERRADLGALADGPEQLAEQAAPLVAGPGGGGVEGLHQVHRPEAVHGQLGVVGDVEVAGEHPLAHGSAVRRRGGGHGEVVPAAHRA
jgi:hypothetical protein